MPRWMTLVVLLSAAGVAYSAEIEGPTFSGDPRIETLVVDVTGEPLAHVGLSLCPLESGEVHARGRRGPCRYVGSGADGVGVFEAIPSGRYRLTASMTGFADTMVFPLSVAVDVDPVAPDRIKMVLNAILWDR